MTEITQINLKKKIIANKTMASDLKPNDIIIIQEPYISKKGSIPSVPKSHKQFLNPFHKNSKRRSAILIPTELDKKPYYLMDYLTMILPLFNVI